MVFLASKARPESGIPGGSELEQAQQRAAQLQQRDDVMRLDSTLTEVQCASHIHLYLIVVVELCRTTYSFVLA